MGNHEHFYQYRLQLQGGPPIRHYDGGVGHRRHGARGFLAAQLVWPELNFNLPWTSFGRLRPLHTNAVIFAFGGCALFATSFYSVQRTCQTNCSRRKSPRSASGAGNW
jgi:hypothetical protein